MPGDMAMKRPSSGVVRRQLDDDVGVGGHDLDVATLGVLWIGEGPAWEVPCAWSAGCQDEEVMAVQVDGMGCNGGVVDYEADGAVGAEVVDVPLEEVSMRRNEIARSGSLLRGHRDKNYSHCWTEGEWGHCSHREKIRRSLSTRYCRKSLW